MSRYYIQIFFSLPLIACAFLSIVCCKSKGNNGEVAESNPFSEIMYSTLDGSVTLTLLDKDRLEISGNNNILVYSYSIKDDLLRAEGEIAGTTQVLYFFRDNGGLRQRQPNGTNGLFLYSPSALITAKDEERKEAEAAMRRASEAAEELRIHNERVAEEASRSIVSTKTIKTFTIGYSGTYDHKDVSPVSLEITDASIRYKQTSDYTLPFYHEVDFMNWKDAPPEILFRSIKEIRIDDSFDIPTIKIDFSDPITAKDRRAEIKFKLGQWSKVPPGTVDCDSVKNTIIESIEKWRNKFPISPQFSLDVKDERTRNKSE